jgi:putative oxidoreductase
MFTKWSKWALLPLRLVFGLGLAYHGFPKLFSRAGHASFIGILQGMGVPLPRVMVWLIGALEFFGGLAIVGGAFTTLVSIAILVEIIINLIGALIRGGFPPPVPGQQPLPGYESSLSYGAAMLALLLGGAGVYSVDGLLAARRAGAQGIAQDSA